MPKWIHIIALALLAFISTCCHHKEGTQDVHPVLPSLHITITPEQLDSILTDRDNKIPAYALLTDANGDTLYNGSLTHIKTRGNDTWNEKKKPFAIKFPKKQSLFGLERSKSFVLLANACDESHIRNAIALDLARAMGIPATRYAYLTLYINDNYWGLYQMTNKVDIGKDALDITDLEKLNELANPKPLDEYEWYGKGRKRQIIQRKGVLLDNDPNDISGGYLIDNSGPLVAYDKSVSGFVSVAGDHIQIRSPKHASPREVEYIAELYNEMECAVHASEAIHPETGRHYSEYLDVESFARYYLLNEVLLNRDGGWASFLMYKETDTMDTKFYAGPAWDYDRILNNLRFQRNFFVSPNELYINEPKGLKGLVHSGGLMHFLCQHEDFQQAVISCYLNEVGPICHQYLEDHSFDSLASLLSYEANQDNVKYGTRYSADYESAVERATDFLRKRVLFFDWYYSSTEDQRVTVVFKKDNGMYRKIYYPLGETICAPQIEIQYNRTPIFELFYQGTDSLVPDGTVFHSAQTLELRQREPTKREVQIRRIKKKLRKIGVDF